MVAESIEKVKVPHAELDRNVDNVDSLISTAAERNSVAFARKSRCHLQSS